MHADHYIWSGEDRGECSMCLLTEINQGLTSVAYIDCRYLDAKRCYVHFQKFTRGEKINFIT